MLMLRPALLSLRPVLERNSSVCRRDAVGRRNVSVEQYTDRAARSGFVNCTISNERFTGRENALVGEVVGRRSDDDEI